MMREAFLFIIKKSPLDEEHIHIHIGKQLKAVMREALLLLSCLPTVVQETLYHTLNVEMDCTHIMFIVLDPMSSSCKQ